MGKIPRFKKSNWDERVKDILKVGALPYKSFRKNCLYLGMSPSTFDDRYKALIRDQIIERIDLVQLIPRIVEADAISVRDCLDTLKKGNNIILLRDRLNQFQRISRDERVVHLPGVLNDLEFLSRYKPILDDEIAFEELMHVFWNIVEYENKYGSPDTRDFLLDLKQTSIKHVLDKIMRDKNSLVIMV
jgi:hypothetical protein